MNKWDIIKDLKVDKLVFWWKWFSRLEDWKVVFITWWVVPDSIVDVRILKKRKDYFETQVVNLVKKSPIEKQHPNNPFWECGGCKWVNIPYEEQLKIKEWQVKESLFHLNRLQENIEILPIIPSPLVDWYRNKVEFSFWKYISNKEWVEEHFNVWFHRQWSFSQIQDFDWCILTDELTNKIYKEIKDFCKNSLLPVYDSKPQTWFFRHILIRRTFFSNELMIILWYNPKYLEENQDEISKYAINRISTFLKNLPSKYSEIKSIYFSVNDNKADIAIWDLKLIYWEKYITEKLLWLTFKISPKSFFQTNSYWAEKLYSKVLELAHKENLGKYTVLDLYAWTWTIGMIFAKNKAKFVYSVEMVEQASRDWEENAKLNFIDNMTFVNKKVEDFLKDYVSEWKKADLLIIDPPRSWMHPDALPNILKFETNQIIYVSCNPSTLTRDLDYILKNSYYKIEKIVPVDMFPHTHHIETIVSLTRK